jgi:hypothetical protein
MRILIIHNFYDSSINSGENSAVKNEMQLLLEAGHDVTLFSKQNEPHKKMQFSEKFSVGIKFITGRGSKQEFKALLDSKKFDVCHFHNVFPLIGTEFQLCRQYIIIDTDVVQEQIIGKVVYVLIVLDISVHFL